MICWLNIIHDFFKINFTIHSQDLEILIILRMLLMMVIKRTWVSLPSIAVITTVSFLFALFLTRPSSFPWHCLDPVTKMATTDTWPEEGPLSRFRWGCRTEELKSDSNPFRSSDPLRTHPWTWGSTSLFSTSSLCWRYRPSVECDDWRGSATGKQ